MSTLALDLSTSVGWAFFAEDVKPDEYGVVSLENRVSDTSVVGYPWNYVFAVGLVVEDVVKVVERFKPGRIVIEETNLGSSRYSQKILEWIHLTLLNRLQMMGYANQPGAVSYVSSSVWRKKLGVVLTPADKANNKVLAKAKRNARDMGRKLDKKQLGLKGKITIKHVAIRYVKECFGLDLLAKDDDIADAICLGWAFIQGAKVCDGER